MLAEQFVNSHDGFPAWWAPTVFRQDLLLPTAVFGQPFDRFAKIIAILCVPVKAQGHASEERGHDQHGHQRSAERELWASQRSPLAFSLCCNDCLFDFQRAAAQVVYSAATKSEARFWSTGPC